MMDFPEFPRFPFHSRAVEEQLGSTDRTEHFRAALHAWIPWQSDLITRWSTFRTNGTSTISSASIDSKSIFQLVIMNVDLFYQTLKLSNIVTRSNSGTVLKADTPVKTKSKTISSISGNNTNQKATSNVSQNSGSDISEWDDIRLQIHIWWWVLMDQTQLNLKKFEEVLKSIYKIFYLELTVERFVTRA